MKCLLTKTSDYTYNEIRYFNSMEDLKNFIRGKGEFVISEFDEDDYPNVDIDCELVIEDYDDYRE